MTVLMPRGQAFAFCLQRCYHFAQQLSILLAHSIACAVITFEIRVQISLKIN